MAKASPKLSPEAIGVTNIPTGSLQPNPYNPRMLFDKKPLAILRESIGKVGILVPLTVYRGKGQEEYTILDGQRRWMCAVELKLKSVPANLVAEPDIVQNIVTMFQIHKLREDWELMPTALKMEILMERLEARSDRKLAELTGLDQAMVARCKKLLSYSRKYQDLMLDPDPNKRIKADFFIELYAVLSDRTVNGMHWFSKDRFIRQMLEKYLDPASDLKAVTDFRLIKQHINNAHKANKVAELSKRLRQYTEDNSVPMEHLEIKAAGIKANVRGLRRSIEKIEVMLRRIDVEEYYGENRLWDSLERLFEVIRNLLRAADRRIIE
jgi:ParB/RepB/Spo0J family partition protein